MEIAAVQNLLSQGDRSLEEHTQDFLDLRHLVDYDDGNLCFFPGRTQLEDESTPDGADGPQQTFIEYVDWVLQCGSPFTISESEEYYLVPEHTVHAVHAQPRLQRSTISSPPQTQRPGEPSLNRCMSWPPFR